MSSGLISAIPFPKSIGTSLPDPAPYAFPTPEDVRLLFIGTPSRTIRAELPFGFNELSPLSVIWEEFIGPEPADKTFKPATFPINASDQLLDLASSNSSLETVWVA